MKNKKILYIGAIILVIALIVGILLLNRNTTPTLDNSKESIEIVNGKKIEHSNKTSLNAYLNDKLKHKKISDIIEPKLIYNMTSNNNSFDYYNRIINVEIIESKVNFKIGTQTILTLKENNDIKVYSINNNGILFISNGSISVVNNNNIALLSNIKVDDEATPLISGKKLYYGTPKCNGQRSNGKEGEVVEIFELNLEKNTNQKIANLDHNKGWKC